MNSSTLLYIATEGLGAAENASGAHLRERTTWGSLNRKEVNVCWNVCIYFPIHKFNPSRTLVILPPKTHIHLTVNQEKKNASKSGWSLLKDVIEKPQHFVPWRRKTTSTSRFKGTLLNISSESCFSVVWFKWFLKQFFSSTALTPDDNGAHLIQTLTAQKWRQDSDVTRAMCSVVASKWRCTKSKSLVKQSARCVALEDRSEHLVERCNHPAGFSQRSSFGRDTSFHLAVCRHLWGSPETAGISPRHTATK